MKKDHSEYSSGWSICSINAVYLIFAFNGCLPLPTVKPTGDAEKDVESCITDGERAGDDAEVCHFIFLLDLEGERRYNCLALVVS